jgi:gliding motility-associated protein GldE
VALITSGLFFKLILILWITQSAFFTVFLLGTHKLIYLLYILCFIVVYIILVEIIPKAYAEAFPERYSLFSIYFLVPAFFLFSPFSKLFIWFYSFFLRKIHSDSGNTGSEEYANEVIASADDFTDEQEIAKGIAKFGDIDVSQILRPKVDVISLDFSQSLQDILKVILESGYSRIPVFDGEFDNMKGVLYVKDLLPYIYGNDNFIWQTFIRPPYFIPESKKVIDLLNEFKNHKIHMAIVVDEYGCILGIVTLEDVLEEIVGEISDESDEEEDFYSKRNENTYIFDAKISLNDFCKIIQVEPDFFDTVRGDADTLAGLILELKGEIPLLGEEISYKQFIFKIEAVDSRRIIQIQVTIKNGFSIIDASL